MMAQTKRRMQQVRQRQGRTQKLRQLHIQRRQHSPLLHRCIHAYVPTYLHACIYTCVYMRTYMHAYMRTYMQHTHTHTHAHTNVTYVRTYAHTHIRRKFCPTITLLCTHAVLAVSAYLPFSH